MDDSLPSAQLFLFFDSEVEKEFSSNDWNLTDIINREGHPLKEVLTRNPATAIIGGTKDPTTVLLGSAALILALTPILSRIISELVGQPILVQHMELRPVLDAQGNIIKDANGQPLLQWVEVTSLIEINNKAETEVSLEAPFGLKISFKGRT